MKSIFREFLHKDDVNFTNLEKNTLVVFDTNTLLNIYRYSDSTQNKFINSVKRIKNNIWIPYQVGLEFNLNRKDAIYRLKDNEGETIKSLKKNIKEFKDSMNDTLFSMSSLKSSDTKEYKYNIQDYIEKECNNLEQNLDEKIRKLYQFINPEKDLANEIATLFDGKTGESYSNEELEIKLKDASIRYKNEIPPGYKDKNKGTIYYNGLEINKNYGDLIVWYQILDKAKDESIKKIVFVTDDVKEDWWYIIKGERIGPRAELKNEMLRIASSDFYMIDSNTFLSKMLGEKEPLIDIRAKNDIDFNHVDRYMNEISLRKPLFLVEDPHRMKNRLNSRANRKKYLRYLETLENPDDASIDEDSLHIRMLLQNFEKSKEKLVDTLIHKTDTEKSNDELLSEISLLDREIQLLRYKLNNTE